MQVGDKCKTMRAKKTQCSRKKVGEEWKTSVKSCVTEHSEHPEWTARQVEKSGEKWEASLKSCGQRIQSVVEKLGDSCEPEHSEHPCRLYWETSWRQVENKWRNHADHPECTGRQVENKWRNHAVRESRVSLAGNQAWRQT